MARISTPATFIIDKTILKQTFFPFTQTTIQSKIKVDFINDFIQLDLENNKMHLFGFLFIFFLTPLGLVIWFIKYFSKNCLLRFCCNRLCKRKKRDLNTVNNVKSDSALSGECGCIVRIRKGKNNKIEKKEINDSNKGQIVVKNFFVNNNNNSGMKRISIPDSNIAENRKSLKQFTISMVRSACVLIKLKPNEKTTKAKPQIYKSDCSKQEIYSISLQNLLGDRFASEEDLNDYCEFKEKSLVDLREELNDLDQLKLKASLKQMEV
ncbi:unnamed protein product [Brachionus calyciflorus]|uniref:Uncharacterized protein n=1 Tax=Brachionus calyciflorus TaxID=104777 RepID=A0A813NYH8_9BILA|nr:unnamed protein product [Brachionus calyciflorus]